MQWRHLFYGAFYATLFSALWMMRGIVAQPPTVAAQNAGLVAEPLPYDIVYVRQPRRGDNEHVIWPEVFHPATLEPGSDLMLLHANGSEEILVDATDGAVTDPFVSFDSLWVYYAYVHNATATNDQRGHLPLSGADI